MGGSCGQLPVPSVGDLTNGGGRREAADGHIAAGDLHTPTSNLEQTTTFKKKVRFFRSFFRQEGPPGSARRPPACRVRRRLGDSARKTDCAVGSG